MSTKTFTQQLTNTYHLGVHEATYRWTYNRSRGRIWFTFSLGCFVVFLCAVIFLLIDTSWGFGVWGIALSFIFLLLPLCLGFIREDLTYVFSEGFVQMRDNAPVRITRWDEIEMIWIECPDNTQPIEIDSDSSPSLTEQHHTYCFATASDKHIEVSRKVYRDYFQKYKYRYLQSASLQLLTEFEAGHPISFGDFTFEKQGIRIQHNFYHFSQIRSFFLNTRQNTVTIEIIVPRPSKPTVVKQPPSQITIQIQRNRGLFEDLLCYAIRYTAISYNRDDAALYTISLHGIWPPPRD
jgi:hypothetical protein